MFWRGEMEIVFKRGSLNKDGSAEPSRLNRVYSTLFVPEDYSMLVAKEGFLFSAQFHEKWGIVDSGFTSSLYISKDTGVTYVVRREVEDDGEPFEEKMTRLTSELSEMFAKSHELEDEIRKKLGAIGYEV